MNESVGYAINPMLERMGGCGFLFKEWVGAASCLRPSHTLLRRGGQDCLPCDNRLRMSFKC